MLAITTRQAKPLLVWLHVLTSVGWSAMAVVQLTVLALALGGPPGDQVVLLEVALKLENGILDPFGITAAYTGIMLSALTPWGFFRHWWVTVKFWLTTIAILLGSVFLGKWLEAAAEAAKAGSGWTVTPVLCGTGWTLATLLLMAWPSVAKPFGRRGAPETREERTVAKRVEQNLDPRVFLLAMLVPVVEYVSRMDYPLLTVGTGVAYTAHRGRLLRRARRAQVSAVS